MSGTLEARFHEAMLGIYRRAKAEAHYDAKAFLSMVVSRGGVETAHTLIASATPSQGYEALWRRKRLDLTMERMILEGDWAPLFSKQELREAVKRLRDYGFTGPLPAIDSEA